jgi:hypothetical protein
MRELIDKNQRVTIIPSDFKCANKGTVEDVSAEGFTLKLDYPAEGILVNNYCEFYTDTKHGTLYFESFAKEFVDDWTLKIASPARHKFLQRRRYTRIKFIHELSLTAENKSHKIKTLDISAGGMKFKTSENIDIEGRYTIVLPLSETTQLECYYRPIRIELCDDGSYTHSGRFEFKDTKDRMTLIQYCTKRSIEIANK